MRRKIYATAGATTLFMGLGRPEFIPGQSRPFEEYLCETAQETASFAAKELECDEGVIASFMAWRYLKQGHLAGFLPYMIPSLKGKSCRCVESACASGGKALTTAIKSLLAEDANKVFVCGVEMQTVCKALYGADYLAGAAHYSRVRKEGHAHFFPSLFDDRACAYFARYGQERTKEAMAYWYAQAIENAKSCPKAQEYHNKSTREQLIERAMQPADPERFLPHLTSTDCSKISDGAASLLLCSQEGLKELGIELSDCVEIVAVGEAQGDITKEVVDKTKLTIVEQAVSKALTAAKLTIDDMGYLELHDCFTITGLLSLEAIGCAKAGQAAELVLSGQTGGLGRYPTNSSGGLIGFGHPTGATGVRQLVDVIGQLTGRHANQFKLASPYAMMVNMGGDDISAVCLIAKKS